MLRVLTSQAFAPSHITGFFKIYPDGSTGAGLNTAHGAHTKVVFEANDDARSHTITLNGQRANAFVSEKVVDKYTNHFRTGLLHIEHKIEYPAGFGMGMSGAGAFSLSLALNKVLEAGYSFDECMQIAVESEIESGTGLGDVIAQKFHGLMIGLPPYPSREVELIPCKNKIVACGFFEPLDTGKIIRDEKWKERINSIGDECMQELGGDKSIAKFMELSRHFTFETGLASRQVKEVMKDLPQTSMAMLGQTVFLIAETESQAREILADHCKDIHISTLAEHGAKLIDG